LVPDDELLALTQWGNKTAYTQLWTRYVASARAYASRLVGPDAAEDLASDAFVSIYWAAVEGHAPTGEFRPYMYATIRDRAVEDYGIQRVGNEASSSGGKEGDAIARAFFAMDERHREALWLGEVAGLSATAIAARMNERPAMAVALKVQAKAQFAQLVQEYNGAPASSQAPASAGASTSEPTTPSSLGVALLRGVVGVSPRGWGAPDIQRLVGGDGGVITPSEMPVFWESALPRSAPRFSPVSVAAASGGTAALSASNAVRTAEADDSADEPDGDQVEDADDSGKAGLATAGVLGAAAATALAGEATSSALADAGDITRPRTFPNWPSAWDETEKPVSTPEEILQDLGLDDFVPSTPPAEEPAFEESAPEEPVSEEPILDEPIDEGDNTGGAQDWESDDEADEADDVDPDNVGLAVLSGEDAQEGVGSDAGPDAGDAEDASSIQPLDEGVEPDQNDRKKKGVWAWLKWVLIAVVVLALLALLGKFALDMGGVGDPKTPSEQSSATDLPSATSAPSVDPSASDTPSSTGSESGAPTEATTEASSEPVSSTQPLPPDGTSPRPVVVDAVDSGPQNICGPKLSGTAEPGDTLTITTGIGAPIQVLVGADGSWSMDSNAVVTNPSVHQYNVVISGLQSPRTQVAVTQAGAPNAWVSVAGNTITITGSGLLSGMQIEYAVDGVVVGVADTGSGSIDTSFVHTLSLGSHVLTAKYYQAQGCSGPAASYPFILS
jgi:DNA-directed RNA polymerase specialized sigma24 family protein